MLLDERRSFDAVAREKRVARKAGVEHRLAGSANQALRFPARGRARGRAPRPWRCAPARGFFIMPATEARRLTISARSFGALVP